MSRNNDWTRKALDNQIDETALLQEARLMISPLTRDQHYELYEIVLNKLQKFNSSKKEAELQAVKKALETSAKPDASVLHRIRTGTSEMSRNASPRDMKQTKAKKKV